MRRTVVVEELFREDGTIAARTTTTTEDGPSLLDDFVEARREKREMGPLERAVEQTYAPMLQDSLEPMPEMRNRPWWEDGFYHASDGKVYPGHVRPTEERRLATVTPIREDLEP